MEIKGIIKQVAREGKAVLLSDDRWYSHFSASTGFQVGDSVKITYNDKVKGDQTYHNWTLIEPSDEPAEVERPYGKENYQVERQATKNNDVQVGVYTSYAKDIFCACISQECPVDEVKNVMQRSIDLVKQAKEAFE